MEYECICCLYRLFGLHNLNFSLGFNATYSNISYSYAHYRGFPMLTGILPRNAYEIVTKPTFTDNKTRLFRSVSNDEL